MSAVVSIIATLALLGSTAAACLNAAASKAFTLRVPSGPDSMGIIVFFIFSIVGWLLTLLGALLVASLGALGFLPAPPAGAAVLVVPVGLALGFLSFLAMVAALDHNLPGRTAIGWAGAFILPVAVNAYLGALAWMDPESSSGSMLMRTIGMCLGGLGSAGAVVAVVLWFRAQAASARRQARARLEVEAQQEQNRIEQAERDRRHQQELDALPDDAPLSAFAAHLFIDKSDAHHAMALERIASLPNLAARLDHELLDPDPLAREYLLNCLRVMPRLDPALAAALAPAIARCFEHLAEDLHWLAHDPGHRAHHHARGMTLGLLETAARFPVRFTQPARTLRVAFDRWPDPDTRQAAQELLDRYLTGQPVS